MSPLVMASAFLCVLICFFLDDEVGKFAIWMEDEMGIDFFMLNLHSLATTAAALYFCCTGEKI